MKLLLDVVTKFSEDIGMTFGLAKCAYIYIKRGKGKSLGKKIHINGIEISGLEEGDIYKYLGVDEDIGFDGSLNKDKIRKEFLRRKRKIWKSELYSRNKVTEYNTFALPVLTTSVGVLDWDEQELKDLDVKTRKVLDMSGSLQSKRDVDRLYVLRSNGGRGLNSVLDMLKNRMTNLSNYLQQMHNNPRMEIVKHRERDNIIRIGNIIRNQYSTEEDHSNEIIKNNIRKEHYNSWMEKVTHGFLQKKLTEDTSVDNKATNQWLKSNMSSHVEGYIMALQEQEMNTRDSLKRKELEKETRNEQHMPIMMKECQNTISRHYRLSCCLFKPLLEYPPQRHSENHIRKHKRQ